MISILTRAYFFQMGGSTTKQYCRLLTLPNVVVAGKEYQLTFNWEYSFVQALEAAFVRRCLFYIISFIFWFFQDGLRFSCSTVEILAKSSPHSSVRILMALYKVMSPCCNCRQMSLWSNIMTLHSRKLTWLAGKSNPHINRKNHLHSWWIFHSHASFCFFFWPEFAFCSFWTSVSGVFLKQEVDRHGYWMMNLYWFFHQLLVSPNLHPSWHLFLFFVSQQLISESSRIIRSIMTHYFHREWTHQPNVGVKDTYYT